MKLIVLGSCCVLFAWALPEPQDIDKKFPLDPQLRVLADDVNSARYRELVTTKM